MKTLIFNGTTRRNGDTEALINALTLCLEGEIRIISDADGIKPCADCRYCREHDGCCIDSGMREIYRYINECDNIVIASPIWFASLSGPMLNMASRLQSIYSSIYFRGERPFAEKKNGVILITGARPDTAPAPIKSATVILKMLNADVTATVCSLDADRIAAKDDSNALTECAEVARKLNALQHSKKLP